MTWKELTKAIQQKRPDIELSAIRHQCLRMKLAKQIQIRWSKEDIEYLIDNYQMKGDKEIAIDLNKFKRTFRVIDGKKVYRTFNKKHIEKKMNLLGLKRSTDEYNAIRKRNIHIGLTYAWTKESNAYTLGILPVFDEGAIRIWNTNGYDRKYIKIDGRFVSLARHNYEKHFGSIPTGYNVWHRDGDQLNCAPENLYLVSDADQSLERSIRHYPEEFKSLLRLNNQLNRQINKITSKNEKI